MLRTGCKEYFWLLCKLIDNIHVKDASQVGLASSPPSGPVSWAFTVDLWSLFTCRRADTLSPEPAVAIRAAILKGVLKWPPADVSLFLSLSLRPRCWTWTLWRDTWPTASAGETRHSLPLPFGGLQVQILECRAGFAS